MSGRFRTHSLIELGSQPGRMVSDIFGISTHKPPIGTLELEKMVPNRTIADRRAGAAAEVGGRVGIGRASFQDDGNQIDRTEDTPGPDARGAQGRR